MIGRLVEASARRRWLVLTGIALALVGSLLAARRLRLDALPELAPPQVVVVAEWMGRDAGAVEAQVTAPLVAALSGAEGAAEVRGDSMAGMAFLHVRPREGADPRAVRAAVGEALAAARPRLPAGVEPALGPDAGSTGWILQYALRSEAGGPGPAALRALQDRTLRPALQAVAGVAEVAGVGGFLLEWQVVVDPARLAAHGLEVGDVAASLRRAGGDAGGGLLSTGGREIAVRGRGAPATAADLEGVAIQAHGAAGAVRVGDVGRAALGPAPRQGLLDWNGEGEAVGGVVVLRQGADALAVVEAVKARLAELAAALPPGVRVELAYDRSNLVRRALATLRDALLEEALVVGLVVLLFLGHLRSALLPVITLPVAVALALLPLWALDVPATIMSLGGIAIALGAAVDAELVMLEASHRKLESAGPGADRRALLAEAAREVTPAILYSLLVVAAAFLPVFALDGQAGRLFRPMALTKTAVMLAAALLSVTLAPALRDLLLRGPVRSEAAHGPSRWLRDAYRPFVEVALRNPRSTVAIGLLAVLSAAPLALELGREFMPPLDEGDLLYMPTTLPGLSAEEARRQLTAQDRLLRSFPEVASVFGKAGRADTATDPAPLSMVETTVQLRPRDEWRTVPSPRWWSGRAPAWLAPALRFGWPDARPLSRPELVDLLDRALRLPGWTNAFTMPVKARQDMLATGVRTAVGVEVLGRDPAEVERLGLALERLLAPVRGARSAVFERSGGALTLEITPRREALAAAGLAPGDLERLVEQAVGGEAVGAAAVDGERHPITVRYPADLRSDPEALRRLPVPVAGRRAGPAGAGRGAVAQAHAGMGGRHAEAADLAPPPGAAATLDARPGAFRPPAPTALGWIDPAPDTQGGPGVAPLGELAEVRLVSGPAMIRDADGLLLGLVHVDVDEASVDVGGFVEAAQAAVAAAQASGALRPAPGHLLRWTGQWRLMEETRRRLLLVIPLTLLVIAGLLWLHFRDLTEVLIVLLSLPFALVGSVWLMWLLGERLSAASWVGLLALAGLAVQTGVVMIVYIDAAYAHRKAAGLVQGPADVVAAHLEGTVARLRPKLMTVGTMLLGLAPLLWSRGAGAEVMRRVAIPMIGGLATSAVLTLEIIPVVYTAWRTEQLLWERLAPLDPPLLARLRRHAAGLRAALALLAAAGIVALAAPGARAPAAAAGLAASLAAAWAGAASLRTRREAVALVWPAAAPRPGAAESPLAPAPSPEAAP